MRSTKILATVGPSTASPDALRSLLAAGVSGFRLNFSHGTREEHRSTLARLHSIIARNPDPVALVADLQGPKIRIGNLVSQHVTLPTGGVLQLDNLEQAGDARRLPSLSMESRVTRGPVTPCSLETAPSSSVHPKCVPVRS